MRAVLLSLLLLSACSPDEQFLERSIRVDGHLYRYRVWLPHRYTKLRRWPVILYLHGSGERGDDNERPLTIGLPAALVRHPLRYRAIVVIPQCPLNQEWYGAMEPVALAELDQTIEEFRGDRRRVDLTGISMGGAGAWYLARHPGRFAAVVPVCGEVTRQKDDPFPIPPPPDLEAILKASDPFAALAARIGKTPVWAFHGAKDDVIPVDQSRRMVAALHARYTEVPDAGHDVWDAAYDDPQLPGWLASQRR